MKECVGEAGLASSKKPAPRRDEAPGVKWRGVRATQASHQTVIKGERKGGRVEAS